VEWSGFEVVVAVLVLNLVVPALMFAILTQSPFFQVVYGPGFPQLADVAAPSFEASAAVGGTVAAIADRNQRMEISAVRGLWMGTASLPVQMGLLLAASLVLTGRWPGRGLVGVLPARISLAVATWAWLTVVVLAVHAMVNWAFAQLGWLTEDHPLSKLSAARPTIDHVLFFFQAGIAAPVIEEVLFRGVLLWWGGVRWSSDHRASTSLAHSPTAACGRSLLLALWPLDCCPTNPDQRSRQQH
jgi:hypothetical protein